MSQQSSGPAVQIGGGFLGLLTLIFITLKLCAVIDWSWWWVLAPLWIPAALGIGIVLIVFAAFMLVAVLTSRGR